MPGATIKTDNYTVGAAELWFAATIADDNLLGSPSLFESDVRSLGNITTTGITPDVTYLEHYVSSKGKRVKDKIVANTVSLTVSFTVDEMNHENLNKFFFGESVASPANYVKVLQNTLNEGCARLKVDTDIGQDMVYIIPKCVIRPDGDLTLADDDWHSAPFVLEVLEYVDGDTSNSTYNATWVESPFGRVDTSQL